MMIWIITLGASLAIFITTFVTVGSSSVFVRACEGNTLNMRCDKGLIHIIQVNYGRLSRAECNRHGYSRNTVNCRSLSSLDIVKEQCSQKSSCSVHASNDVFGDSCAGTSKYLEVEYRCIEKYIWSKTAVACDRSQLDIACGAGETIKTLSANYGRTSNEVCNGNGKAQILTTQCKSPNSIKIVDRECFGKQKCTVSVSKDVFGNPCKGTRKYLEVDYVCTTRKPCRDWVL